MRWIAVVVVALVGCGHKTDPFASSGDPTTGPARDKPGERPARSAAGGGAESIEKPVQVIVDTEATAPNTPTTARVRVVPHAPFHINDKLKFKLALEPADGVELARTTFTDAEKLAPDELVVPVALTATARGDLTIRGVVDVGVCSPRQCLTEHLPVSIQIASR